MLQMYILLFTYASYIRNLFKLTNVIYNTIQRFTFGNITYLVLKIT